MPKKTINTPEEHMYLSNLEAAIIAKNMPKVYDLFQKHNFDQHSCGEALYTAVHYGNEEAVGFLVQHTDKYDNSDVLIKCASEDATDIALLIIPHCNPKDNDSEALQYACINENHILFDALYPKSNPKVALRILRDNDIETHMLEQRIKSDKQKKLLLKAVADKPLNKTIRKI